MEFVVSCAIFERRLYHFQADELPQAERAGMQAHLDSCEACARRLELEDRILGSLRSRLKRAEPAPDLLDRVRAGLDQQGSRRDSRNWLRASWVGVAAASLLLAAALAWDLGPAPVVRHMTARVTVVDRECDRAGRTFAQQRACTLPAHLNALRVGADDYWSIGTDREQTRALVTDRLRRGHVLEVQGELYPRIGTFRITDSKDLGPASTVAGAGPGRRRASLASHVPGRFPAPVR